MKKSEATKNKILKKGMELASSFGLLSLTIGEMAKALEMSRTGVISHFANKEDMQIAILKYAEQEFITNVIRPSYDKECPEENLQKLRKNWLNWIERLDFELKASCPFVKAAIEYKDRPDCAVKIYIKDQQGRLLNYFADLASRCVESGFFKSSIDPHQFAYEFDSCYLGHSIQKYLLEDKVADDRFNQSIDDLITKYCRP